MPRYLEDFEPGSVMLSPARAITESDALRYGALTGDWYEHRSKQSLASEPVAGACSGLPAQGSLLFSISLGLALGGERSEQPEMIAFLGVERMRFLEPVILGETIQVRQTVESAELVNETSGLLSISNEVFKQPGAKALSYTAKFLVSRRPRPSRV